MKTFKQHMEDKKEYEFSLPDYPSQTPPDPQGDPTKKVDDNEGDWVTGDPIRPIKGWKKPAETVLKKAEKQIEKDRNDDS